jgi:Ner family transcriptional regulator
MFRRMAHLNTPKKPPAGDWHNADIVAAIWKRGTSLRRLAREHGYAAGALDNALRTPWPKAEGIIAACIGVAPQTIWPSRYHADGRPRSGRNERGIGRIRPKSERSTGT